MTKRPTHPINASSMTASQLATVLSKACGDAIDAAAIEADLEAGAPRNDDGSVNLIRYAAWLVQEASKRDRTDGGP